MCSYNWCTAFFKIMFRVGCSGVERLVLSPHPLVKVWGQSISVCVWCGLWCTSCTEITREIHPFFPSFPSFVVPSLLAVRAEGSQPAQLTVDVVLESFQCGCGAVCLSFASQEFSFSKTKLWL